MRTIKHLFNLVVLSLLAIHVSAQSQNVGIGTLTPHPSAALHITGEDQGLLPPYSEVGDVGDPAIGLLFYSLSEKKYYSWNGTEWEHLLNVNDQHWQKVDNTITSGNTQQVVIGTELAPPNTDLMIVHDETTGSGLNITANNTSGNSYAANLASSSPVGGALSANSDGSEGYGVYSSATGAYGIGVFGTANEENALGGYFTNTHSDGTCLKAIGASAGGTAIEGIGFTGGKFQSNASYGKAIDAYTNGTSAHAGKFVANGANGIAVYGTSNKPNGYGGYFQNLGAGVALIGVSSPLTGYGIYGNASIAGLFESNLDTGFGLQVLNNATEGDAIGAYFESKSSDGIGVYSIGESYAGFFEGNVESHVADGGEVTLGLKEGAGYGFEFRYDGEDDDLELWSTLFSGNTAARMTWKKGGNVGIGTTLPNERLHVNGNARVTGNIFASCGTLTCSDIRYKNDITEIKSVLESINELTGVYYHLDVENFPDHNFEAGRQVGVIAQEIENVYPELVHTDDSGFKSVAYDRLGPILLQGIKELEQKLDQTIKTIEQNEATMESRLVQLEAQMTALESNEKKTKSQDNQVISMDQNR